MNLRLLRGLAGATTLALLAATLLSAPALAANARDVSVGSIGASGGTTDPFVYGVLTNNDPVTVGRRAATTLRVENRDGQTLNHVRLAGGATASALPFNALFPAPTPNSLPAGASFAKIIVTAGSATCSPASGASIECDLGTLTPGAFVDFIIVVNVPSSAGIYPYWVTASWGEGWSSTGANADYQFAVGSLDVKAGCGNGSASYFLGTEPVGLDDGASIPCNDVDASVASLANVGGNGGFAKMAVDSTDITCPAGYKCFGKPVSVSILGGAPVPGGVEWTVKWFGTKTLKGVIHYGDDYATDPTDFVAIPLNKANKCSATKLTDCWVGTSTSAGNTKPVWIQVIFRTDSNGKGGGFL
jgi:hypothetical protein